MTSPRTAVVVFVVGLAGVLVLMYRLAGAEIFLRLTHVRPAWVAMYLVVAAIVVTGHSLRWRVAAGPLGTCPSFGHFILGRLAGSAVGALLPGGMVAGDPVRVVLLAAGGASTGTAAAAVAADRMLEVTSNVIVAVAFVAVFASLYVTGVAHEAVLSLAIALTVLFLSLAVPVGLLWLGYPPLAPLYWLARNRRGARVRALLDGLRQAEKDLTRLLREHTGTVVGGLLISIVVEGIVVVEYYVLLAAFGVQLPLPVLLVALVLSGFSRVVPSPGGLGALEASQVGIVSLTVGKTTLGVMVGLLMRIHETLWMAVGLCVCVARGISLARPRQQLPRVPA